MVTKSFTEWLSHVSSNRVSNGAQDITLFKFNKKRLRLLSGENEFNNCDPNANGCIVYWMTRSFRVEDNWALLLAQKLSFKFNLPLTVLASLRFPQHQLTDRHFYFHFENLKLISEKLRSLDINFSIVHNKNFDFDPQIETENVINAFNELKGQVIVTDFNPLRYDKKLLNLMRTSLKDKVPICQVDATNVLPCWVVSDKLEYSARTLRIKVHKQLNEYLTDFPPVIKSKYPPKSFSKVDFDGIEASFKPILDSSVKPIIWAKPGYEEGMKNLHNFLLKNLHIFNDFRNNPTKSALSNISPWIRFEQISAQRCILEAVKLRSNHKVGSEIFVEEALVRRELTDNFCYYQENYDKLTGAWDWAQKTLKDHENDKKAISYSEEVLENGQTKDNLWNAAQMQLKSEGKMHGFLRMYWAKKILEWHPGKTQEIIDFAIYLNDHYSIDGGCPNGFVGIMWSICGVHDQGWRERPIFGKIRYMNYEGCKRKFNVDEFSLKYQPSYKKLKTST